MADSTMVICKFHHRRVHRASFLGNLNTYPTRDNCWNVCGICHSRNSIRVHRVRLAVKKKIDPKFAQTPHPPHKVKTAVVQAVGKGNFPVLTTPGSHYRMDVAGCSWNLQYDVALQQEWDGSPDKFQFECKTVEFAGF